MKNRLIALITLVIMMFTFLVGCTPSDNGEKEDVKYSLGLNKWNITLTVGERDTLVANVTPEPENAPKISWSSSDPDVASVTNGIVVALAEGTAVITATTLDGFLSVSCIVTVVPKTDDNQNDNNQNDDNQNNNQDDNQNTSSWIPDCGYDGSEVTITFYQSGTRFQPDIEDYIAEFNKLYPNITIEHMEVGSYDDIFGQIKTEIAGGNQPHIAYCYPDHVASYLNAKAVVPLDDLINSQISVVDARGNTTILGLTDAQKADFIPAFYAEGAVYDEAGTMYTLPMSKNTEVLYYNKTFFEEHGLKVPTTWDEMEEVCAQIKAIDPDCIPLGYDNEDNWFITMCMQYDPSGALYTQFSDINDYFKFDNETTRAFVERFKRWYDLGYFTTEEIYGYYASGLLTNTTVNNDNGTPDDSSDDFVQKCYMAISSTSGAIYHTPPKDTNGNPLFETGITTIPQVNPEKPQVALWGPSLCIFKQDNVQEVLASWLFVEFLTTNADFQAEYSMASGFAPVIQSAQNNAEFQQWLNSGNSYTNLAPLAIKLALSQTDAYYVVPAFIGSSRAKEQVGLIMVNVFSSDRTDIQALIDEEFKRAIEECEWWIK